MNKDHLNGNNESDINIDEREEYSEEINEDGEEMAKKKTKSGRTKKVAYVRGHFRKVGKKKVYVQPHYRNAPRPAKKKRKR